MFKPSVLGIILQHKMATSFTARLCTLSCLVWRPLSNAARRGTVITSSGHLQDEPPPTVRLMRLCSGALPRLIVRNNPAPTTKALPSQAACPCPPCPTLKSPTSAGPSPELVRRRRGHPFPLRDEDRAEPVALGAWAGARPAPGRRCARKEAQLVRLPEQARGTADAVESLKMETGVKDLAGRRQASAKLSSGHSRGEGGGATPAD